MVQNPIHALHQWKKIKRDQSEEKKVFERETGGAIFLERAIVGLGGRVGSPTLYPQAQCGVFKGTLQVARCISCKWANGGLRRKDWLLWWQSREEWLHWNCLHPRVCQDQGWSLHPNIQMWASRTTEPARSHLDPA